MGQTSINLIQQLIQSQQVTINQLLTTNSYLSMQIAEIASMIASAKSLDPSDKDTILNEILQKEMVQGILSTMRSGMNNNDENIAKEVLKGMHNYNNVSIPSSSQPSQPQGPIAATNDKHGFTTADKLLSRGGGGGDLTPQDKFPSQSKTMGAGTNTSNYNKYEDETRTRLEQETRAKAYELHRSIYGLDKKDNIKRMRESQQKQKDDDTNHFTTADKLLMDNDDESAEATGLGNEFGEKHKR